MPKGLVSALCLTAQTVLFVPMAEATDLSLSRFVAWTDHVTEVMRSLEDEPNLSSRLFTQDLPDFNDMPRDATAPTWIAPTATKSARDAKGLSLSTSGSAAGLILRF